MATMYQHNPYQAGMNILKDCETFRKVLMANIDPSLPLEAKIEAKIAKLTKQRNELRIEAIEQGYAHYVTTYRTLAPNLTWWKENRPTVWQQYAKESKVNKFTWI